MRPHEVERLRDTQKMYTRRPHEFRALSPKSPTCAQCGRCRCDPLHAVVAENRADDPPMSADDPAR